MIRRRRSRVLALVTFATLAVAVAGQACSPVGVGVSTSSSQSGEGAGGGSVEPTPTVTLPRDGFRIVDVGSVQASMESVLGVTVDVATASKIRTWAPMYSTTGEPDTVSAPMWIGFMSLYGEGCRLLIAQEKAMAAGDRRFFRGWDFNDAPRALAPPTIASSVHALARQAWLRNETKDELDLFTTELAPLLSSTVKAEINDVALVVCTAVLSSLETNLR